jgi:hydrogenase expression/formation protein HypE
MLLETLSIFSNHPEGVVALSTLFGGTKIIDKLIGDQLPRIC